MPPGCPTQPLPSTRPVRSAPVMPSENENVSCGLLLSWGSIDDRFAQVAHPCRGTSVPRRSMKDSFAARTTGPRTLRSPSTIRTSRISNRVRFFAATRTARSSRSSQPASATRNRWRLTTMATSSPATTTPITAIPHDGSTSSKAATADGASDTNTTTIPSAAGRGCGNFSGRSRRTRPPRT